MTQSLVPLVRMELIQRAPTQPQFLHGGQLADWQTLCGDVGALQQPLAADPATDWALFHEDAYPFTVALLALLGAGKRIWLPANATTVTYERLQAHCQRFLGPDLGQDLRIPVFTGMKATQLPAATGSLVIYTSGSSGEPKPITKSWHQLSHEGEALDALWGPHEAGGQVLGSVSHQHIYGLLFRVLWPLYGGHLGQSELFSTPDALLAVAAAVRTQGRAALWISSPAHLRRLEASWPWQAAALRGVFSSGGPLPAAAAATCATLAGQWPLEIYGSSESGGIAWRTQAAANLAWQPMPRIQVRVSENGALAVQSPHLPDADWLQLDDAAVLQPDGRFSLGQRLDRIVKVEGKRLSLPALEERLHAHAWIGDARSLLLKRRREAVAVVASLTPAGQAALDEQGRHGFIQTLRAWLREEFEAVTLPRHWRFPAHLPTDAQGKVQQQALLALFDATSESPAAPMLPVLESEQRPAPGQALLHLHVPPDLACFGGHFAGAPIVPGVALVQWALHFAQQAFQLEAAQVQALQANVRQLKFMRAIQPHAALTLQLDYDAAQTQLSFVFKTRRTAALCASGRFVTAISTATHRSVSA